MKVSFLLSVGLLSILLIPTGQWLVSASVSGPKTYAEMRGYRGDYTVRWYREGDALVLEGQGSGEGVGYPFLLVWGRHPWYEEELNESMSVEEAINSSLWLSVDYDIEGSGKYEVISTIWLESDRRNLIAIVVRHQRSGVPEVFTQRGHFVVVYYAGSSFNLSRVLERSVKLLEEEFNITPIRMKGVEFGVVVQDDFQILMKIWNVRFESVKGEEKVEGSDNWAGDSLSAPESRIGGSLGIKGLRRLFPV